MEWLPCNHGCVPAGRPMLTPAEGYELVAQVYELDGRPEEAADYRMLARLPREYHVQIAPVMRAYTSGRATEDQVRDALRALRGH